MSEEDLETKKTSTPSFTPVGSEKNESKEDSLLSTLKKAKLNILPSSSTLAEELDPFQKLLHMLKNSPQSTTQLRLEEMAEDKKPSGSRLCSNPTTGETTISTTVLVQLVTAEKEVKAALLRLFTRTRKDTKKFLREVMLYIVLNPKAFPDNRTKKLFFLSYMTNGPGEFWKNDKTDLLLAFDPEAKKVKWGEFIDDFKTLFKPLNTTLEAQLKLQDLRMKERADKYTYQFTYLAKQTRYNDAMQIVAFKRGLPKSLVLKIMTRPEGAPTTIKDWMNAAILFDESYKQALEYGKMWEEDNGRKQQRNFRKKEDITIKQISEIDRKEYMAKGLCFRCRRGGHRIRDCPDTPKKEEKKRDEPKKLLKEERFAKIRALVNDQTEEEKNLLIDLMEQEGF
ncbi:hypothetical protein WG66_012643 [Moniliophthora roreri]|uniref:CCHC-type domain-containing protein n=1 Tax=Moniliophthora roreri TaxID=221103 RepID=A0A0W0FYM5_MONRR|nr:hypothetical protein WG66_012643 [Moniliophthora roreri]